MYKYIRLQLINSEGLAFGMEEMGNAFPHLPLDDASGIVVRMAEVSAN